MLSFASCVVLAAGSWKSYLWGVTESWRVTEMVMSGAMAMWASM